MKEYVCKYIHVFEILYFSEKHGTDVGVPRQPYRTSLSEPSMATQQLAPQVFKSLPSSPSFDQNVAEHAAEKAQGKQYLKPATLIFPQPNPPPGFTSNPYIPSLGLTMPSSGLSSQQVVINTKGNAESTLATYTRQFPSALEQAAIGDKAQGLAKPQIKQTLHSDLDPMASSHYPIQNTSLTQPESLFKHSKDQQVDTAISFELPTNLVHTLSMQSTGQGRPPHDLAFESISSEKVRQMFGPHHNDPLSLTTRKNVYQESGTETLSYHTPVKGSSHDLEEDSPNSGYSALPSDIKLTQAIGRDQDNKPLSLSDFEKGKVTANTNVRGPAPGSSKFKLPNDKRDGTLFSPRITTVFDKDDIKNALKSAISIDYPVSFRKNIGLRKYQLELAMPGLDGKNSIICAPTGSGKTYTAGHVIESQMKKGRGLALFIVPTRNLMLQQRDAVRDIVADDILVTSLKDEAFLGEEIAKFNVITLTAQLLLNALKSGEVRITDIDLLVIDECHHTDLDHPYNMIMLCYRKEKMKNPHCKLPQILGLTASLGVGDNEDPIPHYIKLCANLDCKGITHVRDETNYEELLKHNPKPLQKQIISVDDRPSSDPFSFLLHRLMTRIQELVGLKIDDNAFGSQPYENWVVCRREDAEIKRERDVAVACRFLQEINLALFYYSDFRGKDALDHLDNTIIESSEAPTRVEIRCIQYYQV